MLSGMAAFFKSKKKIAIFIITGFWFCITRNNSWPAYLVSIPFIILALRPFWKQISLLLASVVVVVLIYNAALANLFNVGKGYIREAFPAPLQQIGAIVTKHEKEINAEDLKQINRYIGLDVMPHYRPNHADGLKGFFSEGMLRNDLKGFFKIWLKLGARYPSTFIEAYLSNNLGFWYAYEPVLPDGRIMYFNDGSGFYCEGGRAYLKTYLRDILFAEQYPQLPTIKKFYDEFANARPFSNWPIIGLIINPAFPFSFMLVIGSLLLFKKSRLWVALIPTAGLLFTLMAGPVAYGRYIFPFVAIYPLILGSLYLMDRKEKVLKNEEGQN
jgi:hypothetical protein